MRNLLEIIRNSIVNIAILILFIIVYITKQKDILFYDI